VLVLGMALLAWSLIEREGRALKGATAVSGG
jgi:hypothetical protein